MRVVHLESGRHLYGGARQVLCLIDGLRRRGVDNLLICPRGSAIARRDVAAEVVALPLRGDVDAAAVLRLRHAIAAFGPDLVHVHSRRGADWQVAAAGIGAAWPAVLTRRVDAEELPWAARLKYSRYAAVVAISTAIETELVDHVGLSPARVHRVPSGVDTALYRPDSGARARLLDELRLADDSVLVGVVAQLIPRKGHATLLGALPALVRRHPALAVLAFGRGPLERGVATEIERQGLGGNVRLLGFRDDLPALLPGLDLLAHPASAEGLGLAVLEALSAGVPVVAAAAGGLPDIVDDGVHGILVPAADPDAWTEALDRLIAAPSLRRRMGDAGRRRVEERFTTERMVDGNFAVYRSVLERGAVPLPLGGPRPARSDEPKKAART